MVRFLPELSSNRRQSRPRYDRMLDRYSINPYGKPPLERTVNVKMSAALLSKKGSRRDFLRDTAATALAGSTSAACAIDDSGAQTGDPKQVADHSGGTMAPNPVSVSSAAVADDMDRLHESGRKGVAQRRGAQGMFGIVTALIVQ
jgi:hypothetical protein